MKPQYQIDRTWKEENKSYINWILGVFILFSLFDIVVYFLNDLSIGEAFDLNAFIMGLNLLIIPLAAVNFIYIFKKKLYPYCRTPIQLILVQTIGLIIGVIVGTAIVEYTSHLVGVVDDDYIGLGSYQMSVVMSNFVTNILFGLMLGLPLFFKQSHEHMLKQTLIQKENELNKAYQLKIQSELEAIQAKINPHFLYNSLNSIVSLIHINPDKAEKMVLSLSDLFRYSINSGGGNFSTIKREIELVRAYLEIEYVRFQDQLRFEIIVDPLIQQIQIPKFLIQPLIENAIKHGTSKIENGQIKLEIKQLDQDLHISVFDNGPAFPEFPESGYGLKSTVDKLELLYANAYSFQILNQPEKKIHIQLKNIFN
ncbi:histidine kinase [bacterium SCSIO 12643]|nr:histidine kinase [bacterium SCSIO 12643]